MIIQPCACAKSHRTGHFHSLNFMVGELYLHKVILKTKYTFIDLWDLGVKFKITIVRLTQWANHKNVITLTLSIY